MGGPSQTPLAWDTEVDGASALPVRAVTLDWREGADGAVELLNPRTGRRIRYGPNTVALLEGLAAGDGLPGLITRTAARLPDLEHRHVVRIVRSIVYGLMVNGNVAVDLPPVPDVFADRYERIKELGRGGVGIAWLARDRAAPTERLVVVKHAWNFLNRFAACEDGLRREGDVMRAFDHPSLVRLFDTFEHEGRLHLVREFVTGEELATIVERARPSLHDRVAFTRGVAEGLAHVHDRGYLFLDLKPTNFMLDDTALVRFPDLGLCRAFADGHLRLPGPVGSRGYAAPEVVAKHQASPASDVFGLGRLHYFLATGRKPKQDDAPETLVTRLREAGAEARDEAIVTSFAALDPADRPPDMATALAALE